MRGLTAEEHKALLRSVGTHRADRPLSPLEVGRLIGKAIQAGSTRSECAEALQVGSTQVATFLKLLDLADNIQHLADWGNSTSASISFSALAEFARLRKSDQIEAARAVLQYQLTWKEVVQITQMVDRSAKPMRECVDDVLKLRPQVEKRHLFVGAIVSEKLRDILSSLTQQERDRLFQAAIAALGLEAPSVSGRLGDGNFTILSSANLTQLLGLNPDELERAVNDALEQARPPK